MASTIPVEIVIDLLQAASTDREVDVDGLLSEAALPEEGAAKIAYELRRLRATSDRWRRRGRELSALFSSARELAQLRDVDELLGGSSNGRTTWWAPTSPTCPSSTRAARNSGCGPPSARSPRLSPGCGCLPA
ncbi:hypothetical protein [Actinomadura madurae]|uniref:hypothetical protein n=1 Tax=Actinomadura madurae TaxID=1993 RepID=UPI0020D245D4|nr:hypothetical protein [Actinomadura madurae]MCP9955601.1 hypothetical protein [Actinomadura madurae]MCP9984847.1 hypothetical protein [Actinomadura madurae]MCQ0003604.1 hypothetical protein [Actinomadura madurae]